jgi:hypothetical protein
MQPHVVGVPQTWVQLFWHLENVVVHYGRATRPHPYLRMDHLRAERTFCIFLRA